MSLISSLTQSNQPQSSPSQSGSSKVAVQSNASAQKPASKADRLESSSDSKSGSDFESVMKKELPENNKIAEQQSTDTRECDNSTTKETTVEQDTASTESTESTEHSDDSASEEDTETLAELAELIDAQANWKAEGSSTSQTDQAATAAVAAADEALSAQAQDVLQGVSQEAAAQKNTLQKITEQTTQKPADMPSSLLAQQVIKEKGSPEQFQQDDISEYCDTDDASLPQVKTEDQSTKTSLDIQQIVARLAVPQTSNAETAQSSYSQVAAAQNAQVTVTTQGNAQAAAQARPENEPPLSMFHDPDWAEDLGQRLFRMNDGENGIKEVTLRLDPPSLGTLDIKLKIDDNSLSVQFQSSSPQVRELLQNQADRLRASLNDSNMNLVDVDVSSGQSSGQDQKGQHASEQLEQTWLGGSLLSGAQTETESVQDDSSVNLHKQNVANSLINNLSFSTYA